MSWTIDTGMYYDAGKKCHLLADDLSLALGPLNSALQSQCGGMAGDHEDCLGWINSYDKHAADIVTLTATLANALRRYGDVLEATGYNWWYSNRTTASGSAPARPSESEPLYDSGMALPVTAKGDNGAGLTEEGAVGLLERVGKIPNGDVTKLGAAKDAWTTFAESNYITDAANRINGVKAKFDGSTDPHIVAIEEKLETLARAATLLAQAAKAMVTPVADHASALSEMRTAVQTAVSTASSEVAAAVAITVALIAVGAVFTGGIGSAGAAAGGAVVTVEIVTATAVVIKNAVSTSRLVMGVFAAATAAAAIGAATKDGPFVTVPDLTEAGLKAAVTAIAAMAVYVMAEEAADDEPVWDSTEERSRNPAQDKILTDKDIKELKSRGHDPHDIKPEPPSRYDLYKDGKGNVYIKPKGGKGPGDPTGIRLQ
ncbi:polymorphic toxin type 33 domain-containing protein [Nocardia fluminea]|uniref:polymorphic toxin type 33 domain-containing protein n=1 Tax=Nocardia fluminea TaxID=134984 RepID=UPI0033CC11B7